MRRKKQEYMRNDMVLIISLCVVAVLMSIFIYMGKSESQLIVEVLVDGELIESAVLDQNKDKDISIEAGNIISVKDGYVYMKTASCPDGLCVKQGKIDKVNESIICLPHKVVVRLVDVSGQAEEEGLDVMPR